MGALVRSVIAAIETTLSQSAPKEFPNRLDSTLVPEDELEHLDLEIAKLEDEISAAIRAYRAETGRDAKIDDWLGALALTRNSQKTELHFISNADFMFNRHADFKRPLKITFRRQRLEYLKRLRQEM